jgi:pimeloyl-ACP methyl ester carboxylesterase
MTIALQSTSALVSTPNEDRSWLSAELYPFAPKRFQTPDGALSYVDEGEGAPVLLVHGTPSWSFEWRAVISAMRKDHRCVAPDHLGFGLSDKPGDAPLAPEDHARRLQSLVEALDLRDITLVVHDFGGPIGLAAAFALRERIKRVVVVNSWMWSLEQDAGVQRIHKFVRSWLGRFLYLWLNFSARVLVPASFGDKKRLTKAVHRHYIGPFSARKLRAGPYAMARALIGSSAFFARLWAHRSILAELNLTIVWGDKDPAFGVQQRDVWTAAFPRARLVRVADAGHFVAEERPDVIIEVLRSESSHG